MSEQERFPSGRQLGRLYGQLDDIESLLVLYAERATDRADFPTSEVLNEVVGQIRAAMDELQRAIDIINGRGK